MAKIHDEASKVVAEKGVVFVDGPDGVAVSLTPDAAIETSAELLAKGNEANEQSAMADGEEGEPVGDAPE